MALSWDPAHDGSPHMLGYDGQRLVAQVAFYDVVAGRGPGWVGYVRGNRVTGRCLSSELAMHLVDHRSADA